MNVPAPESQGESAGRYTAERYLRLVDEGVLGPEDRVELLEGVLVAMAPQDAPHASGVGRAMQVLTLLLAGRAFVRCQLSLIAGAMSVPEPDVAVLPGRAEDYDHAHPRTALLVVEVADSSLEQDRLTKAAIYAAANVPEYWIADIRGQQVEVHRDPDPAACRYRSVAAVGRGAEIALVSFPDAVVRVDDLLPVLAA